MTTCTQYVTGSNALWEGHGIFSGSQLYPVLLTRAFTSIMARGLCHKVHTLHDAYQELERVHQQLGIV